MIKEFFKKLKETTRRPEMGVLPGQLAFYFLLMMIPIFTVVVFILQQFELNGAVTTILYDTLPNVVADLVINVSNESSGSASFWVLLISAFIISSNGTYSIIIASNTIYKAKHSNVVVNRIKALIMVIIMILIFTVIFIVPLFGNFIASIAEQIVTLYHAPIDIQSIFALLKYPVTFILLLIFIAMIYSIAPNIKVGISKTLYGATFTSVMWILVTMGYSVYIEKKDQRLYVFCVYEP